MAAGTLESVATMPPTRILRYLFVAVLPLLFLQLPLRQLAEPYPAILFPSGEGVIRAQGSFVGYEHQLFAEDRLGRNHPVALDQILDTVPPGYRSYVLQRGFGLHVGRDVRHKSLEVAGIPIHIQFGRPLTAAQADETRAWLRQKLKEKLDVDAVRIHQLSYVVTTFYLEEPIRHDRSLSASTTVELLRSDG